MWWKGGSRHGKRGNRCKWCNPSCLWYLFFIPTAWSRPIRQTCCSDYPTRLTCFHSQEAWGAFPCQQKNTRDGQIEHPSITTSVSVWGLTASSPYQSSISLPAFTMWVLVNTLHNRLIALLWNAVRILLTHLGRFFVFQPRNNEENDHSLQRGPVRCGMQVSLWGVLTQKSTEKLG